jgi:hypothetical protein
MFSSSVSRAEPEHVRGLQSRIAQMQRTRLDAAPLATHPALASLLPGGALQSGAAYAVVGSTTLLMALLAGPSAAGAWCGVVGVPEFGAEAASRCGIDLDRLVLVPHPGDQWLNVTAALADAVTVVVTRPVGRVAAREAARLAARLRMREATLIVLGEWPGIEARFAVTQSSWSGLGRGYGYPQARVVTVTATGRGDRPRSARLWLPDAHEQIRAVVADEPSRVLEAVS